MSDFCVLPAALETLAALEEEEEEDITDPVLTFWYLEASLGPSSFHLPKTYLVRTKLSTLPSSGT